MEPTRQFGNLFHGSVRNYRVGDIVPARPSAQGFGAYAATGRRSASVYADPDQSWRDYERHGQLPLFGTTYKVEPLSGDTPTKMGKTGYVSSQKGFRVTGIAEHVIPSDQAQLAANREAAARMANTPTPAWQNDPSLR